MQLKSYRDLDVWQKAMNWVELVYRLSASFPKSEQFGLTSQLRRACISVPSNVSEGAERRGTKEYIQFLGIAQGSLAEAETLIELAARLNYLSNEARVDLLDRTAEIGRMLHGLIRSLEARI
jgi:four helix bundle protein